MRKKKCECCHDYIDPDVGDLTKVGEKMYFLCLDCQQKVSWTLVELSKQVVNEGTPPAVAALKSRMRPNPTGFTKGDAVRLNQKGCEWYPHWADRIGVIVREPRPDTTTFAVRFDGKRATLRLEREIVEKIPVVDENVAKP